MPLLTSIDATTVAEENNELWSEAVEQYGSVFSVPRNEVARIHTVIQGMWVLAGVDTNAPAFKSLRNYGIPEDTCRYLLDKYADGVEVMTEAEITNRRKKYAAFEDWSRDHIGEQFSTQTLAEESGFSYPTILKFLKESPLFKRVKNGWWEPVVVETRF